MPTPKQRPSRPRASGRFSGGDRSAMTIWAAVGRTRRAGLTAPHAPSPSARPTQPTPLHPDLATWPRPTWHGVHERRGQARGEQQQDAGQRGAAGGGQQREEPRGRQEGERQGGARPALVGEPAEQGVVSGAGPGPSLTHTWVHVPAEHGSAQQLHHPKDGLQVPKGHGVKAQTPGDVLQGRRVSLGCGRPPGPGRCNSAPPMHLHT